jgi:hypothetical protein
MTKNSTKSQALRTKHLRVRLSEEEYASLFRKLAHIGDADISRYVRSCLFNREIKVKIHDETADKITAPLYRIVDEARRIGVNFNQVVRYIQSKHHQDDTQKLLEKAINLMTEIKKNTSHVREVSDKILEIYDRKNQQKQ